MYLDQSINPSNRNTSKLNYNHPFFFQYMFVSFLSRDNTYKFLMSICLHLEVHLYVCMSVCLHLEVYLSAGLSLSQIV